MTHPTAVTMNIIRIYIYSTGFLLREADIKDPPDSSVHEQYEEYEHSRISCSERLTSRSHQTAASMNIINIYNIGFCFSERLTSRTHPTAGTMNII
jgi:hypothetical protein